MPSRERSRRQGEQAAVEHGPAGVDRAACPAVAERQARRARIDPNHDTESPFTPTFEGAMARLTRARMARLAGGVPSSRGAAASATNPRVTRTNSAAASRAQRAISSVASGHP